MFENWLMPVQSDDEPDFVPLFSLEEDEEAKQGEVFPDTLPILPLKNTVLFPGIVTPITVGRDKSIRAVQKAYEDNRLIGVLSQRDVKIESPSARDLYSIGTIARVLKLLKMPDGSTTAILQGRKRFHLEDMLSEEPYMLGQISTVEYTLPKNKLEFRALISSIRDAAKHIIELSPQIPSEAVVMLKNITNDNFLLNFIASNLNIKIEEKQAILEISHLKEKSNRILSHMDAELQLLELKDQIEAKVRNDIEKQQRDYFLSQQLKTIQEELGQNPQEDEINALVERATKKKWPKNVLETFQREVNKLRRVNPQIAEYAIGLTYLETLLDLPWLEFTKDNFDLKRVKQVLDRDHYGLTKVKERILEHLAVLKLKGDMKAPILCLVGPPGVGKTSLGQSIGKALKRKYVRMSLGGLHDEAEIRGHRKTYIGAMPGRIIQSLKKAKTGNPVFILDEIDKVGKDFRGDPSSALLEVLDPEQNTTFYDNYLELEYDLSKVLFIATANSLSTIQPALLDRMEIIEISGYSREEKVEIAKRHLIPEQRKEHGLKPNQVKIGAKSLADIIKHYTAESGVRNLNREIGSVMRNIAKKVAMEEPYEVVVKPEHLHDILGPTKFDSEVYTTQQAPGVAIGLAWTSVGGEILFIESSLNKGSGRLQLTGNLGDVMKESASTALSYIKAHASELDIDPERFDKTDIHIHVPEGAIPKDGPSAGVTMLTAIASVFTQKPVKSFLAMTGEITLRGKVLPVGGIKEKILAAKRAGLREVLLCKENEKHVLEIEAEYIKGLKFHYVDRMSDVLSVALGITPVHKNGSNGVAKGKKKKSVAVGK
ncbi:MAG: endopeptidase La [Lewinellaceae bacterium]|nr:endopeptidase La [Saprospiraceae bacterium]MCB9332129.1 endopeptidase La [Lewinellaceae bacterium]